MSMRTQTVLGLLALLVVLVVAGCEAPLEPKSKTDRERGHPVADGLRATDPTPPTQSLGHPRRDAGAADARRSRSPS